MNSFEIYRSTTIFEEKEATWLQNETNKKFAARWFQRGYINGENLVQHKIQELFQQFRNLLGV